MEGFIIEILQKLSLMEKFNEKNLNKSYKKKAFHLCISLYFYDI